jgi:hypothetical protein
MTFWSRSSGPEAKSQPWSPATEARSSDSGSVLFVLTAGCEAFSGAESNLIRLVTGVSPAVYIEFLQQELQQAHIACSS